MFYVFIFYTGNPLPRLRWNVRGEDIDSTYGIEMNDNTVANVLRIDHVHRENLGKKLICEASNMPNIIQISTSVTMNVYRKFKVCKHLRCDEVDNFRNIYFFIIYRISDL